MVKMIRFAVFFALVAVALPASPQALNDGQGHPLKGVWLGEWGTSKSNRNQIVIEMDWDGKAVTGTINPGVIWSSKYAQFGVEAVVPINERTGRSVGVIGQLHFYLDDLFPRSLGRPLFGYR